MSRPDQPGRATPVAAGAPVLVVMAKPLVAGHVKRRLAATIGAAEALAVYDRLLASTLAQAEQVADASLVLALVPAPGAARSLPAHGPRWAELEQRGETLAERLAAVFDDLFAGGAGAVVAVASDSPPIPTEYLRLAFERLAPGKIVLGPAADGGYYALGIERRTWSSHGGAARRLVADAPMGRASLLSWTLTEAARRGLEATQLPLWLDVDEAADLPVLERLTAHDGLRGEATVALGLREVYLHVTNRCGSACLHCYNRTNPWEPGELTTGEWRRAIDECIALGATSFVFLGGDPLLRDDLCELLEHVTGRRGLKARLFFNSPITAALAAELAAAGHGRLRPLVSIDGPEEIHDELRFPGNHAAVIASIANLLAVGLEPVANTVLLRPTLPGLPALARELKRAGVARLHLILPHQRGGLPENLDLVPSGAEMLAGLRALLAVAGELDLTVDNLAAWRRRIERPQDFCTAGCRDLAIDPYGRVHACTITTGDPAFVAGDLRHDSLEHIWRSSPGLRLLRAARARDRVDCAACPVVDACGGDCWMQAHYAARVRDLPGGPSAPFPYCELVRPVFAELLAERRAAAAQAASARPQSGACGGQANAGAADYALFDCI
jgi:rSAM/selenodomain-associated transferase 1